MQTPTPPPVHRVRHQPTPRDPNLPPTMRVSVEVGYVQTCPDCRRVVKALADSCISDPTVTGFRLVPGRKHAHEVTEGVAALPGLTHGDSVAAVSISDTNGSAPAEVEAMLFTGVNGFDPEGR